MWKVTFWIAAFLAFLMLGQPSSGSKSGCKKKETTLVNLEIAENFVKKAKELFPNCTDVVTNSSECGAKEKAAAYLDVVSKIISETVKNYPTCNNPDTEDPKEPEEMPKGRDCYELFQKGHTLSGVYTVWPRSSKFANISVKVYCDMETDGGGWTVIQRRGDFTPQEDFYRNWQDYKTGFGNVTRDFWIGNDNLYILSNQGNYTIRFDLKSADHENAYAVYKTFLIDDEQSKYKLHIGGFTGNAGDSMARHNGLLFYTKDRDNSGLCANNRKGAWWYDDCAYSNLNGPYKPGMTGGFDYLSWYHWKNAYIGLAGSEMKIRPAR